LLDHQLDVGASTFIGQDLDVFETHQGPDDFTRVAKNEGASCFLAHTSSMEHLRRARGDSGQPAPRQNPKNHIHRSLITSVDPGGHNTNHFPTFTGATIALE
jgi:hypothetical protein